MANTTSPHILSTSANLLGFCLFVITAFHVTDKSEASFIDEISSIIACVLALSCVFSFVSIRTKNEVKEQRFENVADYLFLTSLIGIIGVVLMIALNIV